MPNENDKKIKELLKAAEKKKAELGVKPKPHWKTNGIINKNNINTLNNVDAIVSVATDLILEKEGLLKAHKFLEVAEPTKRMEFIENALDDLKLRVDIIKWDAEKKKLQAMEKKLKDLRSADAKTEDELSELTSLLS